MVIVDRDTIVDSAEMVGVDIREGYAFRQPPDNVCVGIEFDSFQRKDLIGFFIELSTRDVDLATNMLDVMRTDDLGNGYIAYFPGYALEPVETD